MNNVASIIFAIVISGLIVVLPFAIVYSAVNWRRLIWENKGRIFRIKKEGNSWLIEKKFLCFFVEIDEDGPRYNTKEEAITQLSEYLEELYKRQNHESYIVDYTQFISDPKRLIETKKIETKRIKKVETNDSGRT